MIFTNIIKLLDYRRLNEALKQLNIYADKSERWDILPVVENLQINYEYLLKNAKEGKNDPERSDLYVRILRKAYELADQINFDRKMLDSNDAFARKYRSYKTNPAKSFSTLLTELLALNQEERVNASCNNGSYYNHGEFKPHLDFVDELFYKTVTSSHWSSTAYEKAYTLLNKGMSFFDIEVWISAITLSLLNYFDMQKFLLLINMYLDIKNSTTRTRALVGIALACYYHEDRIKLYIDDYPIFEFLLSQEEINSDLSLIQKIFLLSRNTETYSRKYIKAVLPQLDSSLFNIILKEIDKCQGKTIVSNNEKDKDKEQRNSIYELKVLQQQGADTFMEIFQGQESKKFFNEMAHWFYPFYREHPDVDKILKEEEIKEKTSLISILESSLFCDLDKYSLVLFHEKSPLVQIELANLKIHNEILSNIDSSENQWKVSYEESKVINYRHYIQNLYRFYKTIKEHKQEEDIFSDSLNLWKSSYLRPHIITVEKGREFGNYLLDIRHYKDAAEVYKFLLKEYPVCLEFLQKIGFIYQNLEEYHKALIYYNEIYVMRPQDVWALKHIAQCHTKIHNHQKALEFYLQAAEIEPDNLETTLQIGKCLVLLHEYDEALKYLFKVEYLNNTSVDALRAIAWCYYMTDNYKEAARYYERVVKEFSPNLNDWLNYGHVHFTEGDIPQAVACYKRAAAMCQSHDEFVDIFSKDLAIIDKKGVDFVMLFIIQDLV